MSADTIALEARLRSLQEASAVRLRETTDLRTQIEGSGFKQSSIRAQLTSLMAQAASDDLTHRVVTARVHRWRHLAAQLEQQRDSLLRLLESFQRFEDPASSHHHRHADDPGSHESATVLVACDDSFLVSAWMLGAGKPWVDQLVRTVANLHAAFLSAQEGSRAAIGTASAPAGHNGQLPDLSRQGYAESVELALAAHWTAIKGGTTSQSCPWQQLELSALDTLAQLEMAL